jgi:hypothetical protein
MLIFWPQRLVILATPRTGTTSLEAALESLADVAVLRPPDLKHTTALTYRRHLAPYLEAAAGARFRVVAMMREPTDWLGSWYRARLREAEEEAEEGRTLPEARDGCLASFATFVEAYLSGAPPGPADVGSQAEFLGDGGGGIATDLLFRYDRFDAFTAFLESELDCELILPRLNTSPSRNVTLPEPLARQLRTAREADFTLYRSLA